MTNSDRLQEIRERAEDATPGPWFNWGVVGKPEVDIAADPYADLPPDNAEMWARNAEFIAASREDIPYLLQLVTEQQREIDRCRKALEAVNEFAKEDDICTHKTIGEQHGWGACFVCLIQATAQGALRGENGPIESDDEPEAKGYRKQERPI